MWRNALWAEMKSRRLQIMTNQMCDMRIARIENGRVVLRNGYPLVPEPRRVRECETEGEVDRVLKEAKEQARDQ